MKKTRLSHRLSLKNDEKRSEMIDKMLDEYNSRSRESRKIFSLFAKKNYLNYPYFLRKRQYREIKRYLNLSHTEIEERFIARKKEESINLTALSKKPNLFVERDSINLNLYCTQFSIIAFYDKKEKILRPKYFCSSRIIEHCKLLTQRLDILKQTFESYSEFENFISEKELVVAYTPGSHPLLKWFGRYRESSLDLLIKDTKSSDLLTLMVRGKVKKRELSYYPLDKTTINKEFYESFYKEFNRVYQTTLDYNTEHDRDQFLKIYHMITV